MRKSGLGGPGWGVVLSTALAPAAWGSTYLVTTEMLPADGPLLAGAARALPVGLLLVLACGRLPEGSWWWRSFVLGALNIGLFFALLFVAAYRLPGGVAATVGAVQPLLVAALAVPLLGERLSAAKAAAGALGLAGVALLVLRAEAALDAVGVAAALAGAVSMAAGVVLTKRWTERLGRPAPLFAFTAWQLVAGGGGAGCAGPRRGGPATAPDRPERGGLPLPRGGGDGARLRAVVPRPGEAAGLVGLVPEPREPPVGERAGLRGARAAYTAWQGVGAALVLAAVLLGQVGGGGKGGVPPPSRPPAARRESDPPGPRSRPTALRPFPGSTPPGTRG